MKGKSKNKSRSRVSGWAIPTTSLYTVAINHVFPEEGGTSTYSSYDVITDTSNISRCTSIRLQFVASAPTTFIVRGGSSTDGADVVPIDWIWQVTSKTILAGVAVKTLTLRYPRRADYTSSAAWRIIASGPLTITGECSFTARNDLETSS